MSLTDWTPLLADVTSKSGHLVSDQSRQRVSECSTRILDDLLTLNRGTVRVNALLRL